MAFNGEAISQNFKTLRDNEPVTPTILLPNKELWDCCSDFKIKVLADDSGVDQQNDFSTFLDLLALTTSTAAYTLYKDNVLVATLSGFTNYGVDYPLGFKVTNLKKYVGYRINWALVLADLGEGVYKVGLTADDPILGGGTVYSFEFKLCAYRVDRADGTIRLQWWQNGTIGSVKNDKESIDYLDLNWVNQIRLPGFFGFPGADYVKETIHYNNGMREWTFDEQEPLYILKTKPIPSYVHNIFRISIMQSDRCTVTDYNSVNAEKYVNKEIMFQTEYKPQWKPLISKLAMVQLEVLQRSNLYKKHRK